MSKHTYSIKPEKRAELVQMLGAVNAYVSGDLAIEDVVIVTTENDALGGLIERLVQDPITHLVDATPRLPEPKAQDSLLPPRACEWCGREYQPRRKNQRHCGRPDCKAQDTRKKKPPAPKNGAGGGVVIPTGQDHTWMRLDTGEQMNARELEEKLNAGQIPTGTQMRHILRGRHVVEIINGVYAVKRPKSGQAVSTETR